MTYNAAGVSRVVAEVGMEWTEAQMRELRAAVRTSPVPYIRVKALAVLNVARGATRRR